MKVCITSRENAYSGFLKFELRADFADNSHILGFKLIFQILTPLPSLKKKFADLFTWGNMKNIIYEKTWGHDMIHVSYNGEQSPWWYSVWWISSARRTCFHILWYMVPVRAKELSGRKNEKKKEGREPLGRARSLNNHNLNRYVKSNPIMFNNRDLSKSSLTPYMVV